MADKETKSTLLDEVTIPDDRIVRKWEQQSGKIQYDIRKPGEKPRFISPKIGRGLEETTELGGKPEVAGGEITQEELSAYGAGISSEKLRKNRMRNKYPEWNNLANIDDSTIPGGKHNQETRHIIGWMNNETVRQTIAQDPLFENRTEERLAREALAREIIKELEKADTEAEAIEILKTFDVY